VLTVKSSLLLVFLTLLSSCKFSKTAIDEALDNFTITYTDQAPTYLVNTSITANVPSLTAKSSATFSVTPALPNGLSLDPATGVISGTPTVVTAQAAYTIVGVSSDSETAVAVVVIRVNPEAPSDLQTSATTFTLVKNIAMTPMTSSVATGSPVTYSITPSLPAGLTLNSTTGTISGTPTAVSAATNYVLAATNVSGDMTIVLSLEVEDSAVTSLSYAAAAANYTISTLISPNIPFTTGGSATSFSISPALPAGISLDSVSGVISGTPTALSGSTNYTVTATNFQGSATATISIQVTGVAPTGLSYPSSSLEFTKNTAITSLTPTVSGIVTGYTVNPALPAGLSLNASTGVISGTPTVVTSSATYNIRANNGSGYAAFDMTIVVKDIAPSALTYTTPNVFSVGSAISSLNPTVTGSVVSYAVAPSLPAGLSLDTSTGVISGTPSAVTGIATYTVTATNSGGSATFAVSITVNPAAPTSLSYTTHSTSYVTGTAITNNTPTVTGIVDSYSVSPALPAGLSLNTSTGVISGTPTTVTANANYTVTASNVTGSTTRVISFAVTLAAPSSLTYSANPVSYPTGSAITNNNPTSSGGAVASYSVSPALPTGLSLNTGTGVISGTPTVATAAANYTVTATNATGSTTVAVNITVTSSGSAPSGLSYSGTNVIKGCSISLSPTVTGTPTSYSTSGAFQTGLSFNTTTGVISGTPSASGSVTRMITATNGSGSTTASVTLVVSDSTISYSWTQFIVQEDISQTPTVTGLCGSADTFSITSGTTPNEFSIDTSTGEIYGTQLTGIYGEQDSFEVTVSSSAAPAVTATETLTLTRIFNPALTEGGLVLNSFIELFDINYLITVTSGRINITPVLDGSKSAFFDSNSTTQISTGGGLANQPTFSSTEVIDFNDDGMKELVAIDTANQAIHIYSYSTANRAFEWNLTLFNTYRNYAGDTIIRSAEITGSGLIDLVIMNQDHSIYSLESFQNRSSSGGALDIRSFSSGYLFYEADGNTPLTTYSPIPMVLFDSNKDGIDEMAIFSDNSLYYYSDLSAINDDQIPSDTITLPIRAIPQSVAVSDFNNDGYDDIVLIQTSYISAFNVSYDPGRSSLTNGFSQTLVSILAKGTSQSSLRVVDIDNDSFKDIVFYDFTSSKASLISAYVNMTKSQFTKINQQRFSLGLTMKSTGTENCLNEFTNFTYDRIPYYGLVGCFVKAAYPLSLQSN
jgi:hypothetical protein